MAGKATGDRDQITGWTRQYSGCNGGLATGAASGLLVVDADAELGMANYAALNLPATLTAKTSRGAHHYFRIPAGADVKNSAGKLGDGIDVRGTGGYVVCPPSIHDSGHQYAFQPFGGDVPEAPAALLELVEQARKPERAPLEVAPPPVKELPSAGAATRERACGRKALEEECAKFARLPSGTGTRNAALNEAAFNIGQMAAAGWVDEAQAWGALWDAASDYRRQDGDAEAEATMRSGWNAGMRQPRAPLGERDIHVLPAPALADEPWPEPEPLRGKTPDVAKLTPEMLPAAFRPMVEDIARRMQVPLDFPGVIAVAVEAGLTGRRACIQPKEKDTSWVEFPNLWGGIVAPPGSMKSPIISAVTAPAHELEGDWWKEHEIALQAHTVEAEAADLDLQTWKKVAAKRGMAAAGDRPREPPQAPAQKRLITSDATFEKLHSHDERQPRRILASARRTGGLAGGSGAARTRTGTPVLA